MCENTVPPAASIAGSECSCAWQHLYRGVSLDAAEQALVPKGNSYRVCPKMDGSILCDRSWHSGATEYNATRGHNVDSTKYKTSGISTTPRYSIAFKFATQKPDGSRQEGLIYKLSCIEIVKAGIICEIVDEQVKPEFVSDLAEKEIILHMPGGGALPNTIVVGIKEVEPIDDSHDDSY